MNKLMCFVTGGHRFKDCDTVCKCDDKTKTATIIVKCYKCGVTKSFTSSYKNFGIPEL